MRKKISFLILSSSGAATRQLTFSAAFLKVLVVSLVAGLAFVTYDYVRLKKTFFESLHNEAYLSRQQNEIKSQRKQIQAFAGEINNLKSRLVDLNQFEKKIRVIANIEKDAEQDGLFGVGGSIPEDLDAKLPLTEKHNSLLREMHQQVDQIDTASVKQAQDFSSLLQSLEDQETLLACTPAIRPAKGWETSRFGYRKSPFTGLREFHKGCDIAARIGTPVVATADGFVAFAGVKGLLGKVIQIDHGFGMTTRYAHLHKIMVKAGEKVKRGGKIGLLGNSGRSTGPHVHYEVHLNGIPVNPEKYILN